MPTERLAMRRVRDVIRMKAAGLPSREIARRVGAAPSTVRLALRRFEAAGLSWPLPDDVTDTVLELRLFAKTGNGNRQGHRRIAEPDWASWEGRLSVTMRQAHAAGDKLFVDYAGDGVPVVVDRLTGERRTAQIFVAVLGASSFTYAQATWTQGLADWISAHVGAFAAIGGIPALLVPDNTKVAVIKASLYDPQINRTYAEMAAHYGTAILPARPRKPRDKAKVEQAVLIVERWLLGRLRHRTFYSLAEVNAAIGELLTRLNEERPIRRIGVTRRRLLDEVDRPALKPLPASPYVLAEWRIRRVSLDYHVEVEKHYYSVPHRFARAEVEVRFTARIHFGLLDPVMQRLRRAADLGRDRCHRRPARAMLARVIQNHPNRTGPDLG
ncbi:transposase [Bradyrhizobium sp. LM2.7]